jgi:hypothetical protein
LVLLVGVFSTGIFAGDGLAGIVTSTRAKLAPAAPSPEPPSFPDAYKIEPNQPRNIVVPGTNPSIPPHPCGGMSTTPPFSGVSPLSIAYVANMCSSGYGDIAVWQANGHSYVAQSGFGLRMYHIWNVDDPYNPVLLISKTWDSGGTASTALFHFHQFNHEYLATSMRGTNQGCGYFIDNVDNPAAPVRVVRKSGSDWCTIHETFVSTDSNGDADYAWLSGGHEGFGGNPITFMVVLTLGDLSQPNPNPIETGRYIRPGETCNSYYFDCQFDHDSNVVGNRVYLSYWNAGVLVFDKETLAHNINPTPLNPLDSISQVNFSVHHMVPTTDGKFVIAEDEIRGGTGFEKLRLFNIENIASPSYVGGVTGGDPTSEAAQAHNQIIKNLGPHHDLLLSAWYLAGYRLYDIDSSGSTPVVTPVGAHGLRTSGSYAGFGGVWGVDQLPCTVRGIQTTCIYSSDMKYGLIVDALGVNNALDPYAPDPSVITSPTQGQEITTCTFTITGTAPADYWSGLDRIELSFDGGATWQTATGTTNWSYEWNVSGSGPQTIQVRSVDMAGNTQLTPTQVTVNVTASCGASSPTPVPPTATTAPPTSTVAPSTPTTAPPTETSVPAGTDTVTPVATATTCSVTFTDVPVGSTFYPYIHCLACLGIVNGYPDGTFRPNNNVTRGQLSKIVSQAAGFNDTVSGQTFEDVAPGSTFYTFIERLVMHDVMSGYDCGSPGEPCIPPGNRKYFRPNATATRGQIIKIIANAAGWDDSIPVTQQTFEDVIPGSTFWVYVERFVTHIPNGLTGYPCGGAGEPCIPPGNRNYLRPGNSVTRGQTSKLVAEVFLPGCPTAR